VKVKIGALSLIFTAQEYDRIKDKIIARQPAKRK
jgi:hypothetical protein